MSLYEQGMRCRADAARVCENIRFMKAVLERPNGREMLNITSNKSDKKILKDFKEQIWKDFKKKWKHVLDEAEKIKDEPGL